MNGKLDGVLLFILDNRLVTEFQVYNGSSCLVVGSSVKCKRHNSSIRTHIEINTDINS